VVERATARGRAAGIEMGRGRRNQILDGRIDSRWKRKLDWEDGGSGIGSRRQYTVRARLLTPVCLFSIAHLASPQHQR
jgi:hypothetical protein